MNRDLFIIDKFGFLYDKKNLTNMQNDYFYLEISSTIDQLINE